MSLLKSLCLEMRLSEKDVEHLVSTAHRRYRVYTIPKRSGGRRTIAHPSRELKTLQRLLVEKSPDSLLVHNAATAYESGSSILENARRHATSVWIGRLDFSNFFNSITGENWVDFLNSRSVDDDYIELSQAVFFWKPRRANQVCLSVGAPSSPFVSNRILYQFDELVDALSAEMNIIYTRYADDITLSSQEYFDIELLKQRVAEQIPEYLSLDFNDEKTRLNGPNSRKVVTGLIITNDGSITLGKKRRKWIEACVHNYVHGKIGMHRDHLIGYLNFLRQIEPRAYHKIELKYRAFESDLFTRRSIDI